MPPGPLQTTVMAHNTGRMPNADRDTDTGRYTETYPTEEFIKAVRELSPAGTADVADRVGCQYETAYKKLQQLADQGKITSDKIGGSLVWSISE